MAGDRYLGFFVFVAGGAVMAVEMAASRLLAPFFGSSLVVWANLIGIILIALSLGYWVGGRWADRWVPAPGAPAQPGAGARPLFDLGLLAGMLISIIPLWTRPFFAILQQGIWETPTAVLLASFCGAALAFFPPVFLLGTLSPYALRLATREVAQAGRVAGRLYAVSTAGSLFGVYAASFGAIPFWGTRATILACAALLILTAAIGRRSLWAFAALLVPLGLVLAQNGPVRERAGLLIEAETPYQFVQVAEQAGRRYLYINEGGGVQSVYDPDSALLGWYTDYFALLPFLLAEERRPARILSVGVAGGTIATTYERILRPSLAYRLEGVELDPALIGLAHRYFGLTERAMAVHAADGRLFLARQDESAPRQDIIVVDAYSREIYVPFHLATREFFALVKSRLTRGGLVSVNVNATGPETPLLRHLTTTVGAVFRHVAVFPVPDSLNYLVIGGDEPLRLAGLAERVPRPLASLAAAFGAALQEPPPRGRVFTDDWAPTELWTDWMAIDLQRVKMR